MLTSLMKLLMRASSENEKSSVLTIRNTKRSTTGLPIASAAMAGSMSVSERTASGD